MTKHLQQLKEHYSRKEIAEKYLQRKIGHPIGRYRHNLQIATVREIIGRYEVKKLLEIAPGPGRLTGEIEVARGLAVDTSPEMLALARARVISSNWEFRLEDAFQLNTGELFDMAMSFRFVWHLAREQRQTLYQSVARNLSPRGLWVFDILFHRRCYLGYFIAKRDLPLEDFTYRMLDEVAEELEAGGFELIQDFPYLNHTNLQHLIGRIGGTVAGTTALHLIRRIEQLPLRYPQESIVLCRRK